MADPAPTNLKPSTLPPEAVAYARQFFEAARTGNVSAFEAPLAAGLPANLTNDKGDTLLMLAAYHGHSLLLSLLLSYGANPNTLNDRGQSPLAGAVFKNELDVVRILVEGGADPEWGNPSAVQTAGMFKKEELVGLFEAARGRGKGGEEWVKAGVKAEA